MPGSAWRSATIGWESVRRAADRAARQPEVDEECPELVLELDAFLDDPITRYYGVGGEMLPLVRSSHRRRHGCASRVAQ
jgi:hypothetical protein